MLVGLNIKFENEQISKIIHNFRFNDAESLEFLPKWLNLFFENFEQKFNRINNLNVTKRLKLGLATNVICASTDEKQKIILSDLALNLNLLETSNPLQIFVFIKETQANYKENARDLILKIYKNNNLLKYELLSIAIDDGYFDQQDFEIVKSIIESFEDHHFIAKIAQKLFDNKIFKNEEVLQIAAMLAKIRYPALSVLLKNITIADLKEDRSNLTELKKDFPVLNDLNQTPLYALFYYYNDLKTEFSALFLFLIQGQELKEKVKKNFQSADMPAYISASEYVNLRFLIGFETNLVSIGKICDYLKARTAIMDIAQDESDSYQINFENTTFSQEEQQKLNIAFRKILKDESIENDIVDFFAQLFSQPDFASELKDEEKEKIFYLVRDNKQKFAKILNTSDGLEQLKSFVFPAASHGCIYNISNQFHIACFALLVENPADQILYSILSQNILNQAIASSDSDTLFKPDPLDHRDMRSGHISLEALIREVEAAFFKNEKTNIFDISDFLVKINFDKDEKLLLDQAKQYRSSRQRQQDARGANILSLKNLEEEKKWHHQQEQKFHAVEKKALMLCRLYDLVLEQDEKYLSAKSDSVSSIDNIHAQKLRFGAAAVLKDLLDNVIDKIKVDESQRKIAQDLLQYYNRIAGALQSKIAAQEEFASLLLDQQPQAQMAESIKDLCKKHNFTIEEIKIARDNNPQAFKKNQDTIAETWLELNKNDPWIKTKEVFSKLIASAAQTTSATPSSAFYSKAASRSSLFIPEAVIYEDSSSANELAINEHSSSEEATYTRQTHVPSAGPISPKPSLEVSGESASSLVAPVVKRK